MATQTPNYSLDKPTVFGDTDAWGGMWNNNADTLDTELKRVDDVSANNALYLVPIGAVIQWYGTEATIPTGWAPCDGGTYVRTDGGGNIVSPDLVDRFVIAAEGDTPTTGKAPGDTGGGTGTTDAAGGHDHGAATGGHALTLPQIPAHDHGAAGTHVVGSGSSSIAGSAAVSFPTPTKNITISSQGGNEAHTHPITAEADHTHTLATVEPNYYALMFIMKI